MAQANSPTQATQQPQGTNTARQYIPEPQQKSTKFKGLLIGGIVVAAGFGCYYLWPLIRGNKNKMGASAGDGANNTNTNNSHSTDNTTSSAPKPSTPKPSTPPPPKDALPLKKGSNGPNVKTLQNALIAKYGASILPKYGADGDFGTETDTALKSKGLSTVVDQTLFTQLTQPMVIEQAATDTKIHKQLATAIQSGNYSAAMAELAKIKTPQQYVSVNTLFKEEFLLLEFSPMRYTLVTAMFRAFTDDSQITKTRNAFTAMGLLWDKKADKWSLPAGVSGFSIMTTQTTHVWPDANTAIQVPENMVLGEEIERKGAFIAFENAGRTFLVPVAHVRYT